MHESWEELGKGGPCQEGSVTGRIQARLRSPLSPLLYFKEGPTHV